MRKLLALALLLIAIPASAQRLTTVKTLPGRPLEVVPNPDFPFEVEISTNVNLTVNVATGSVTTVAGNFTEIRLTIPVTSGSGFAVFNATGTLRQCAIAPPVGATYDFAIVTEDADNFSILSRTGLSGPGSLMAPRIFLGAHRMKFDNAVPDGTYKGRCIVEE